MPIYDPDHVEYRISHGHVQLVLDGGKRLPAYWAHPTLGRKFPAVALVHDWWGLTDNMRRLANLFAQMGYYVIVPDLFNGKVAQNPAEAMALVKGLVDHGYPVMDQALHILENHHQVNKSVAAVGLGMGGSLAFEAAITRRTKALLIGYPNNPTGAVLERETLEEIAKVAQKHDILVISDEIYDRLVYDTEHVCVASLPGMWDRTILLGGFSKAYAMTGWRLGYAAAPPALTTELRKLHQYTSFTASTLQVLQAPVLEEFGPFRRPGRAGLVRRSTGRGIP